MAKLSTRYGFTLIELAIVLVIIGLVAGSILAGQDLIRASAVRATITQLDRYNTATNTFRDKFNALPGDLNAQTASAFGFQTRGVAFGQGDANGIIAASSCGTGCGFGEGAGETVMFWVDLSAAHLIDGTFSTASSYNLPAADVTLTTTPNISAYLPQAKLGRGNFVYVFSGSTYNGGWQNNATNYFSFSAATRISSTYGALYSNPALTVKEAYDIDGKIDDGLPQSGKITAQYVDYATFGTNGVGSGWAGSGGQSGAAYTTATPGSATTCFDNSSAATGTPGVAGAPQHYSVEISNGNNVACALSFQFQ